jgi:hypothetical protein
MPLDQALRNALRTMVQNARQTLSEDLGDILERTYGVHRDGRFEPEAALPEVQRDRRVRETWELLKRILPEAPRTRSERAQFEAAFDALLRSLAFTHMNRLVAFKLMEHPSRRIIRETVGRALDARGFKFYLADDPDDEKLAMSGQQWVAYENFLRARCGELNREIGVLFDPDDLASRVFPGPRAVEAVLAGINGPDLAPVWEHEEAIGWVYQYWTPKELREAARRASPVPRNSYELAFRNQFYTPEYVVRFLVDNTLGRIWYEMKPDTALRDRCELLVIRPGEEVDRRGKKDPREIRVMDPACGSGHFLLYAFELFETIYREAYDDATLGPALQQAFPDRTTFERTIPRLIVEHNLYGIDIDRRAVQLAALTVFLKAKSRSKDAQIELSHIVCAEPMPGERGLFEDFKRRELPKLKEGQAVVGRILDGLRRHLELAAEAGSLLQAEQEANRLAAEEHAAWRAMRRAGGQEFLFPELRRPQQQRIDFEDVSDERFWEGVEATVERLLREYAEEATGAEGAHRRLFLRDGVGVLRFLDVLRQRYDVVLMNPPFGTPSAPSKDYIDRTYPRTRNDVYAAFVERWLERLTERGRLGAITSRTGFFLTSFARWREEVLLARTHIDVVADLGAGVLDTAMVETAAYVLEARAAPAAAV